ncbi:MAG: glycosyltransferase family 9 protein [Candidatus Krumholzibacteriia bacterium]
MAGRPKILIVRVGRAGDLIMITPAVRSLLEAFPAAEFHLLTGAEGNRVMRGFDPRLTKTWIYSRRFPRSWILKGPLKRAFLREGYDRIYIFEAKPMYRRWLADAAPECHGFPSTVADSHYCERCLRVVDASLPGAAARGWVDLPVTAEGRAKARALLEENGVDPDGLVVGLHPTFSGSRLPFFRDREGMRHRHWPQESFGRLAVLLREQARKEGRDLAVVIDALPEEKPIVEPVVAAAGGAATLLCAPPDFQRYKGLLAGLSVLVTPNTGPMHIAAAVNTPLVALFSRWSAADCGPFMDPARYTVLRSEDTPHPGRGLAAITPETAAAAVWDLIARTGQSAPTGCT